MPRVPTNTNMGFEGPSLLSQVKPENLMMAAAEIHRQGKLMPPEEEYSTPSPRSTHTPDPAKVRPRGRKLRVVR